MSDFILSMNEISKSYQTSGSEELIVLSSINLSIAAGELVGLTAPSGAGKSTLLHICGLLDTCDEGTVNFLGQDMQKASDITRTLVRRREIGFVYQFHHLLPEFSALENVILPQLINGKKPQQALDRAIELLRLVDLENRVGHRPSQLSGGEQQRVAFCRAVANEPKLLLADEPTGNLDEKTSDTVFEALLSLVELSGMAALIATHNETLAKKMNRRIRLKSGQLFSD
jgi:lipoprotein-releasing system ATP-binding protein|tara:strand:+ start:1115 stop:1798 length:684 start_codon:yes stop_codon:yes gene_type:complete